MPEGTRPETQRPLRRILYFDHTAKLSGGEIALLNLVRTLDHTRFEPIVILGAPGPLQGKLVEAGVPTHLFPALTRILDTRKDALGFSTLLRLRDVWASVCYVLALARYIRTQQISLVHTNSLKSNILGGAAARLTRTPLLWHVRDRIEDDYLPRPVAGLSAASAAGYPIMWSPIRRRRWTLWSCPPRTALLWYTVGSKSRRGPKSFRRPNSYLEPNPCLNAGDSGVIIRLDQINPERRFNRPPCDLPHPNLTQENNRSRNQVRKSGWSDASPD